MKILFVVPYPLEQSPSQRFRFEQYFGFLSERGVQFETHSFFNSQSWSILYTNGNTGKKVLAILSGFLKRFGLLLRVHDVSYVFIHREATPFGPPFFEWIIGRMLNKKIIYDFDDAIWLTDKCKELMLDRSLRWRSKVSSICRWSYKVSCGNEFIKQYATRFNEFSILNPTTIDTENLHNPVLYRKQKDNTRIVIGWTGSHSTLKYLYLIQDVLQQIQARYPYVDLLVIADKAPLMKLERLVFKKWSKGDEIKDLLTADIGIMPLPDDDWSKGKCGFKALQYMALEIPAVCSPIGVNTEIIDHGKNGYLSGTSEEWLAILEKLILDSSLRSRVGKAGRISIIERYSVIANTDNFLSLFS